MLWLAAMLALAAATLVAVRSVRSAGAVVTVAVDGHAETIRTVQTDVGRLLGDLGLELRLEDQVQPSPSTPIRPGSALVVSIRRARPSHIEADGGVIEAYTRAATVGALVGQVGLRLNPQDEVWMDGARVGLDTPLSAEDAPPQRVSYALGRAWLGHEPRPVRLVVRRAVPITVDDGSAPYAILTTAPTLGEALLRAGLTLYLGDRVEPKLGSRLHAGLRVTIERSTPVFVSADGRVVHTRTRAKTVGDALVGLGVLISGSDRVTPTLDMPLTDDMEIRVTRVSEGVIVEREVIPFESIMAPDDALEIDLRRVAQEGKDGEFRRRFRVVQEEGTETARAMTDAWVAAEPVTRVVSYGRKLVSRPLETPDGAFSYWRKVRMYATSYSPARSGTPRTAPWYGRTRIGMNLRKGILAVDPEVIPLQSRLYVPGYGLAVAGDTGGGVRGRMIDLGYEDQDYQSWHQWVDVYFLDPPPSASKVRYVLPNYPPSSFPRSR